ncbi:unnamed protein product [Cyprideis torosa]|uniref:Uncharacterized protein n=1 Tax=Cyprideis torosa TaxID=163714 RepID=A0A7R8WZX6_9CRUS|nr:unnamed protein product [Cyprideis torosa]CAG0910646.1 unnamed protein product [Cyprideis torosa]
MCHYMLPDRGSKPFDGRLDGRYANEALALLVNEIKKAKTEPNEYVAKVFGGGSMIDSSTLNISGRNIEAGRNLVARYGFQMEGECLGGVGHRNVIFDLWSGQIWLKTNEAHGNN